MTASFIGIYSQIFHRYPATDNQCPAPVSGIALYMANVTKPAPRSIADTIELFGRMLTVKELASLLGESPKTLYARVRRGGQPAVLIGGAVKFDPYVTAEWLRSQAA
jgi:hypothetical protein